MSIMIGCSFNKFVKGIIVLFSKSIKMCVYKYVLKMGKDRTLLIAEGLLNDDLDMLNGIIYYTGNMLEVRYREILIMDVRMCRKVSNSLSKDISSVDVSSDDDLEEVVSVLDRCNYVGIIYELSSEYDDKVYIGSTTNLEKRLEDHMLCAYIYDNYKIRYCGSYEILKKKGKSKNNKKVFVCI